MIVPVNKHLLVKVVKKSVNDYGVLRTKENEAQECGEVIARAVGTVIARVGEMIYFKSYSAIPVNVNGDELHFVKEDEVLGYEKNKKKQKEKS